MFLKSLKIENGPELVREIPFKKGLNLILDSPTSNFQESGNNIGKSTILKLIDFCLGGDGENVYIDQEFPEKTDVKVENFLKSNNIVITLVLRKDFDSEDGQIVIHKNFLQRNLKIQKINGKNFTNDNLFEAELKKLIFDSSSEKPSWRQIIAKNIRYEKNRLDNTIKVLHNSTTFEAYESLYLFWFGIDMDETSRKQRLYGFKKIEEALIKKLKKGATLQEIKQSIAIVNQDINDLNALKSSFNINVNYEEDLQLLNDSVKNINRISTQINAINARKIIITEAKEELEKDFANVDADQLKDIYKTAKSFIPNL